MSPLLLLLTAPLLAPQPPLERFGAALGPARPRPAERRIVVMTEAAGFKTWPVLRQLARQFEAEHPGVRVELLDSSGAAGAKDKNKFMIAGGLELDITRIDITELPAYLAEGALVDLQPFFDADPDWNPEEYFRAPLDALRDARGHLYGLPSTFTPYVMYVNETRLGELGLERPRPDWTWNEFLTLARRATEDTDGDGRTDRFGISLTQWLQALAPWVWQAGGRWIDPDRRIATMSDPRTVEALSFVHGLLHKERVASFDASLENQLSRGLFQAGKALFYGPVGYWETYRFQHIDAFRWDVLPLPRGRQAATSIAMTVYVVPRTSAHPELAYRFLRRLAGERYQRTLAEIGNGVPGLIRAARSESFLDPQRPPASEHVFLDVLDHARLLPPLVPWRRIEALCKAELASILLDERCDVPALCAAMEDNVDAWFAQERDRRGRPRMPPGWLAGPLSLSLLALAALFVARRGPRPGRLGRREERAGYSMIALWAAGFTLFLLGPAIVTFLLSLTDWSPLRPLAEARWVGLENYGRLATDPTFHTSLGATALYAAVSVPLGLALALALALLLAAEGTFASLVRTVVYIPAILSPVIAAAVWRWILDADQGLLNQGLRALGLEGPPWLRDATWVVPSFVLMSLWGVGTQMLVFLAALKAVDPTLLEAARVDGAGPLRRLWHVTLPAISPVVLFNLITGLIAAVQIFAQPYVMTQGGPGDASRFLVLLLYESGFRHLDMGYASAIAWVLFVALAMLCLGLLASSKRWVYYAGGGGGGRT